jgi:hypothetical protein
MLLWTFACSLMTVLLLLRAYLARTSLRLNVHLSKIDLLKPMVDGPLEIVRGTSALNSLNRLAAGFALSDARSDCLEALTWINRAQDSKTDSPTPRPSRLKSDFFAWLILCDSETHYLVALKLVQPQAPDARTMKKLAKRASVESFHLSRATEFIERLNRKQ